MCSPFGGLRASFGWGGPPGRQFVRTAARLGLSKWHAGRAQVGRIRTVSADWIVPLRHELFELRAAMSRALGRPLPMPQAWVPPPYKGRRTPIRRRRPRTDQRNRCVRQSRRRDPRLRAGNPLPVGSDSPRGAVGSASLGVPMLDARSLLNAAVDYIRRNPDELVRAAVNAAGLRFGVPLAALRYLSSQAKLPRKAPKDIDIGSSPPAIRISLSVDAMGTPVRATAAIKIDEIDLSPEAMRIGVKLSEVKLALIGSSDSPVATLIKSGALDLSKPGNLVKFLPKRPPAIVEADDDRIVIDLMKVPAIANNEILRRALAIVTPVMNVRAVETDRDHIYVALRASPRGLPRAFAALRSAF